jgi:hypothetical protein
MSRFDNQKGFPAHGNASRGRSNQPRGFMNDRSYGNSGHVQQQSYPVHSSGYGEGNAYARSNEETYGREFPRIPQRTGLDGVPERSAIRQQPSSRADGVRWGHQDSTESRTERMLKQISDTLTQLSARVGSLEKVKGPDTKIAAAIQPTRPAVAGPSLQRSCNDDFVGISKVLYKMVQLGHHESNWMTLPNSIGERLKRLTDDINPPMSDSTFKNELDIITQQYGEEIRRLVSDHIVTKKAETAIQAGTLNPIDVGRAKDVANKYLITRLGKRLTEQRRAELMNSATALIGKLHRPKIQLKVPAPLKSRGTPKNGGTKRTAQQALSAECENRFSVLEHETINVDTLEENVDDDVEPDTSPLCRPPVNKRILFELNNVKNTESKVHLHQGNKRAWRVLPESPDTCVLVVGDSNLRHVRNIPPYWQVEALPGADLCDLMDGLTALAGNEKQFTVVLQAGINHRDKHDAEDETDIKKMLSAVRGNAAIDEIFFNGVSIPQEIPESDAQRLVALNNFMKLQVGNAYYIEPIDRLEVQVSPTDRYKIHYDQDTVDRISQNMHRHLSVPVFLTDRA